MKNAEAWRPTKYVLRAGRLRATRDQSYLAPTSRLAADLSAQAYGEALPAHAHGRLLDFGCGRVPLYGAYRSFIDVNICMDWMEPPGTSHVDVVSDLSREVPLPSSSTDTIIVSSVLEHLPDPARTWSEFERLLAPGGRVIGNVPFYYQLHEAPHDYFRFTEHALRRHIEAAGLAVVELRPTGGTPEILADLVPKTMETFRYMHRAAPATHRLMAMLAQSRLGARVSARTAARFPFGYFFVAQKPT